MKISAKKLQDGYIKLEVEEVPESYVGSIYGVVEDDDQVIRAWVSARPGNGLEGSAVAQLLGELAVSRWFFNGLAACPKSKKDYIERVSKK